MNATYTRFREAQIAVRARILGESPEFAAETIARHYLSLVLVARHLHAMIQLDRVEPSAEIKSCIDAAIKTIQEAHLNDFSIPLDWPTPPLT